MAAKAGDQAPPFLMGRVAAVFGSLSFLTIRALPLVMIFLTCGFGIWQLWQNALRDERFRIGGDTLSLVGDFCTEAKLSIKRLGRKTSGRSLLDPWLLSDLRKEYEASPWVKRVCSLERVYPNRLAVKFILRRPVAQVRQGGRHWMVDADGILLPAAGTQKPREGLPVIAGTVYNAIDMRPYPGDTWNDAGVRDSLALIKLLGNSPLSEDLRVKQVLVHGGSFLNRFKRTVRKRPRLDVETLEGITVRWGTFNTGEFPDEILSDEKMAMLRNLVSRDLAVVPGVSLDVRTRMPGFSLPEQ